MDGSNITIADMVTRIIASGQLSPLEEVRIKKMIEEKQKKTGSQKGRCLTDAVKEEMVRRMGAEDVGIKDIYYSVFKKCFEENRIGRMDAFKLSDAIVKKYKKDVTELYGLSENELIIFMEMFQMGLEKMEIEGMLDFVPAPDIFQKIHVSGQRVSYIGNPYSNGETEKIMRWAECHPTDARGLAVSLWFTGGISLMEIVNLTKKDCWGNNKRALDSLMEFNEGLFNVSIRSVIVRKALDLHPRDVRYVFVVPRQDSSGWKKLTEKGLQRKLAYICQDIGIPYKKIDRNEAIKLSR